MTSQREQKTGTVCEPAPVELERQARANAPTLRDLRKAAQELALAGAFTDQPAYQQASNDFADVPAARSAFAAFQTDCAVSAA